MMITSTLLERLNSHIAEFGEKIILKDVNRVWTWNELFHEAKCYALAIQAQASDSSILPIIVDRGGSSVAAMLACILTGKCFAPLSNTLPLERVLTCVQKTNSTVCIDATTHIQSELANSFQVIRKAEHANGVLPEIHDDPNRMLYVLFTSGSTGEPKGVMVNTGNIENTMLWSAEIIDWQDHDVMGCASLFSFDISMFDLFSMIYFNVCMGIFSNTKDYHTVLNEIKQFQVSSIFSVPQFFSSLLHADLDQVKIACQSLRRILSGGDFFNPAHLLIWCQSFPEMAIYNVWGPTETSIVNTMHRVNEHDWALLEKGQLPPVGKSHVRMPFVLLNESRNEEVTEAFKQGEIVMLGDCVTQGYLLDNTLTASKYSLYHGRACFFTEDLAYLDRDNNLFITGRIGSMVKISGFRVDLNEIEFIASGYENIHATCCIVLSNQVHEKQLQLVCSLKDKEKELDIYAFKTFLRSRLPSYMVPKRIHIINTMPLNDNAKIDRKKLGALYAMPNSD